MQIRFRQAVADDAAVCAPLVYSSGPELLDYMFGLKGDTQAFIQQAFTGGGFLGHAIHTVALIDGKVAAVGAFYRREQLNRLSMRTVTQIFQFFGTRHGLAVSRRAMHSDSVIEKPGARCLYIANLGVAPDYRGSGIGSALIRHEQDKAQLAGLQQLGLDVADNNPRAEALYQRLGFESVKRKYFKGPSAAGVPDCQYMVKNLSTGTDATG